MSHTIVHRPHVHHHVPLLPIVALIAAVLIAGAVLWAVNQPETTTTTTSVSEAVFVPAVAPATVAAPESPVFRHALMRAGMTGGYDRAYTGNLHHLVEGTTLDPVTVPPSPATYEPFRYQR